MVDRRAARVRRRWAIPLLALALVVTQLPALTAAHHGGREIGSLLACDRPVTPPRCTSVADDLRHHVALDASVTPDLAASLRRAMTEVYDRTRLMLIEDERVLSLTDVIAYSADFGDIGAAAWVYCPPDAPQGLNARGDRWCRHQELYFNLNPRYSIFFGDGPSRDHVACHELGHTVGLRHWGNPPFSEGPEAATCMTANTPDGVAALHQIDIDHINAYPYLRNPRRPAFPIVRSEERAMVVAAGAGAGEIVGATEVERPTTLAELAGSADLVVHGRVTAVQPGRVFGPAHHPLHYAAVAVEVLEELAGHRALAGARELVLEVPLLAGADSLDRLRAEMLGTERILFLRNKATSAARAGLDREVQRAERPFHRLVTFGAELVDAGGVAVAPPDESGILDAFAGQPFARALAAVRAATR